MTVLALSTYVPVAGMLKTVVAALFVAVAAPSAVALAAGGLHRRRTGSVAVATAFVGLGAAALALLAGAGVYALIQR
ncbi:MAG TPA: hypothetical protein VGL44_08225 [Gaiellales bacterium]|jgi:hypothetical protein